MLAHYTNLIPLLDQIDDDTPGPGPGEAGIPDVGSSVQLAGNRESCNTTDAILVTEVIISFSVSKQHSDQNPAPVTVSLNCEAATAEMFGETGERTMRLERIATVSGTACAGDENVDDTDFVTGSWYEPESSGQGFSVHKISADRGVVYFYGFDDEGENLWLLGVWEGELELGQEMTIPMDQVSGGFFGAFDPDGVIALRTKTPVKRGSAEADEIIRLVKKALSRRL